MDSLSTTVCFARIKEEIWLVTYQTTIVILYVHSMATFYVYILFCIVAMASSLTLLIGYYHGLLLRDIDTDLINDMCSEGLLSTDDQKIISTGHCLYHKKWFLLEHVRHMDTKTFLEFCKLILNLWPEIGEQLITGTYVTYVIYV